MKNKKMAKMAGALLVGLLASGCGTGHSVTPSLATGVDGEASARSASKLDGSGTLSDSLSFEVLSINRSEVPVRLTIDGRLSYLGARAGFATVTISLPDGFGALAVGHTYRLIEVQ